MDISKQQLSFNLCKHGQTFRAADKNFFCCHHLLVCLPIIAQSCTISGRKVILVKSVVFPSAISANIIVVKRFMIANRAKNNRICIIDYCADFGQFTFAEFSLNCR